MPSLVPERLTNFNLYNDGNKLLGVVDCTMPEMQYMTDTISGAGIAGEVDSIITGHLQAMSATITWRTVNKQSSVLFAPRTQEVTLRGSQEVFNPESGLKENKKVRVVMRSQPKRYAAGSAEVGAQTGSENEFSVTYVKIEYDGEKIIEIDQYAMKCWMDGKDWLEAVREQI